MEPKSISATALQVWDTCPARYGAETINRTPMTNNVYADLGTVIHTTAEEYVQLVYLDQDDSPSLDLLLKMYERAYTHLIGPPEGESYKDGVGMLKNWFPRTADLSERDILSLEQKRFFEVPTSIGPLPLNYIFDRMDRLPDGSIEVVDYKSIRARLGPQDLKKKIQARIYGVAAQIMYPDAPRVWVTFDLFRYDPVGIVFTREENLATWRWIKMKAQEIVDADENNLPEVVNNDCRFCIRKGECESLRANTDAGGIIALADPLIAGRQRAKIDFQMKALQAAIDELDAFILKQAEADDVEEYVDEEAGITVSIGARRTRMLRDTEEALALIGPDLAKKYGGMTMTSLDKLLKDEPIDPALEAQLRRLIGYKSGNPTVRVQQRASIEEE